MEGRRVDAKEVVRLSDWMTGFLSEAQSEMNTLRSNLANNSRQGAATQPIKEHLDKVSTSLRAWDTTELSTLQLGTLKHLGVYPFLGRHGAKWLNTTVKEASYDMATVSQAVTEAFQQVEQAKKALKSATQSLSVLGLGDTQAEEMIEDGKYRVAIIFRADAAINNVSDLKKRSASWHVTIGGIADAIGEKVEDTQITGADTGSLLIFLAMTAKAAALLAIINKSITMVASNILDLQLKVQDLRTKKLTNDMMEMGFKEQEDQLKKNAIGSILEELKPHLERPLKGEVATKLERAIKNLLEFAEDGGEVDIETPEDVPEDEAELDEAIATITTDLRRHVIEMRQADLKLKALTNQMKKDND